MISIIGAGPSGSYLAYLLAKKGQDVSLFEEHSEVGVPIQCTGLVTSSIEELMPISNKFVVNRLHHVKVVSPDGSYIKLKFKKPNILFDRAKFDQAVAKLAVDAGAKLYKNHRFVNYKKPNIIFENKKTYKTDILVGADGPSSKVAQVTGLYLNRKFVVGLQARYLFKSDPDTIEFWLNGDSFGWVVPESDTIARIGIVANSNSSVIFKDFLRKRAGGAKLLCYQSGVIPLYDPNVKTQRDNVYLVGDAATMVKATTYGGIIQGMLASEELAKSITEHTDYESGWRNRVGKELYFHLLIRKAMDKFSVEDCNELLRLSSEKKVSSMLETFDRDYPSKFIFKILMKQPALLKYGLKLLF